MLFYDTHREKLQEQFSIQELVVKWNLLIIFLYKQLKVVSATLLLVCFVCLKQRTFETRKNVFYSTSKALFVLEIIKF